MNTREGKAPAVSIAMPVRNGESHLLEAVNSLLSQTFDDFELLVSDNASTDGTAKLLADIAASDQRVHVVQQPKPLPAIENFNLLLRRAQGEYFMWAAHDDIWEPTFVERAVALLEADPRAVMAFSGFANVGPKGREAVVRRYNASPAFASTDRVERLTQFIRNDERDGKANLIYALFRRERLRAAGGMVSWGVGDWACDMLTVFRLLVEGSLALEQDTLFHKRVSAAEEAWIRSPARQHVPPRELPAWNGYLLGYLRIALGCRLTAHERRSIAAAALKKLAVTDLEAGLRLARRAIGKG